MKQRVLYIILSWWKPSEIKIYKDRERSIAEHNRVTNIDRISLYIYIDGSEIEDKIEVFV